MYEGMIAETVRILGHGGEHIKAYLARPLGPGPFPGVLVIHHMPGWDEGTKEITRRFAAHGYAAICPHLHYREGPEASPDDAAAAARARGGVPDERFLGDAAGAIDNLRTCAASLTRTARWESSVTARAAGSRSLRRARSSSMPRSTATAHSSSSHRLRASR
jgi:carboxymethylenebutenolidase